MDQMSISELESAISVAIASTSRPGDIDLQIAAVPEPYVSPTFRVVEGRFPAEVIFIKAPAAVGKSVTAQYLSARKSAPLLNLAEVAVAAASFRGLITDWATSAEEAFHNGQLPIIVDALDEGRLWSGENSFTAFLEGTVNFLTRRNRAATNPTKLILLGREESAEFSQLAVNMENEHVTTCTLQLDFFAQDAAFQLIGLYAENELSRLSAMGQIGKNDHDRRLTLLSGRPMRDLKFAFFGAIESALEIEPGHLWEDHRGRTFAGYAPVLASIGTLLAEVENPLLLTNKLQAAATREAWDIINTVIQEILEREKKKLTNNLQGIEIIPENAYDQNEQFSYLTQLLGGRERITFTGHVKFNSDQDTSKYLDKVSQFSREHPFIRSGKMANEVLGSIALAYAVCEGFDVHEDTYLSLFRELSDGPFLWRSVRRELLSQDDPLRDGRMLGYLLRSYWNDPMEMTNLGQPVKIQDLDDGSVDVGVGAGENHAAEFRVMPPITIYGSMRDCKVATPSLELTMEGLTREGRNRDSLLRYYGNNSILCRDLIYSAASTEITGSIWLDAVNVTVQAQHPKIRINEGSSYGWGATVRRNDPWRQLTRPSLSDPYHEATEIVELVETCQRNLPNMIVLLENYTIPEGDNALLWAKRYGGAFSLLMRLLVSNGFVERTVIQSSERENKYRISARADTPWEELLAACEINANVRPEIQDLVEKVRREL